MSVESHIRSRVYYVLGPSQGVFSPLDGFTSSPAARQQWYDDHIDWKKVAETPAHEFLQEPNFGAKCLAALHEILAEKGLKLIGFDPTPRRMVRMTPAKSKEVVRLLLKMKHDIEACEGLKTLAKTLAAVDEVAADFGDITDELYGMIREEDQDSLLGW